MTILDRYLARRFLVTIFQFMLAMLLLFIVIDFLTARQYDIANFDVPPRIVALFYLAYTPTLLFQFQTTALAVLVAGLMVLGRAAQDQEITAALAGGVSLRRIARAPILLALIIAIGAFFFEDTLGVQAAQATTRIEREYFTQFVQREMKGISWAHLSGDWTCHILKFNRKALTGQDVYIHAITRDRVEEIRAQRIFWDEARRAWLIEDGRRFTFDPNQEWEQNVERITQVAAPFSEAPEELFSLEEKSGHKSAQALAVDLRRAERLGMHVNPFWVDYHAKFSRPALSFIMIWLAIPFAMRLRRGGIAIGFGVSAAVTLAYLLLFYVGIGLGYLDKMPPLTAAWMANAVFAALALFLLRRTPT